MKRVFSSFNLAAVHHAKNLLAAEGIRAVVKNEFLSSAMGDLPPAECQAELWLLDPRGADWLCACGERSGAQFTQCWKCGAYRNSGSGS